MTKIKDLTQNTTVIDADQIPIYDVNNDRTRRIAASTLKKYFNDDVIAQALDEFNKGVGGEITKDVRFDNDTGILTLEDKSGKLLTTTINTVGVTLELMRTDSASQLGGVYKKDYETGDAIPSYAMRDKLVYWHNGQFYSVGTDTGFTSNDFAGDLAAGRFIYGNGGLLFVAAGAKTPRSLADRASAEKVSPFDFGAAGDETTDDLQAIIEACTSGRDVVIDGNFLVDVSDVKTIKPSDHTKIYFLNSASIKVKPNALDRYYVFNLEGTKGVQIYSPYLIGDRDEHTGVTGQWGHGINASNAVDAFIYRPKCNYFWGDGIYINEVTNLTIDRPICWHNRRQGLSLTSGDGVFIYNPDCSYTKGQNPGAGMDIEPNFNTQVLRDIKIYNPIFRENGQSVSYPHGLVISLSKLTGATTPNNVQIDIYNADIRGNSLLIGTLDGCDGWLRIHNPTIRGAQRSGLHIYNCNSIGLDVDIINPYIHNPCAAQRNSIYDNPITLEMDTVTAPSVTGMRNVKIYNPQIIYNRGLQKEAAIRLINSTSIPQCFRNCTIDNIRTYSVNDAISSTVRLGGGGESAPTDSSLQITYNEDSIYNEISQDGNIDNSYLRSKVRYTGGSSTGIIYLNSTVLANDIDFVILNDNSSFGSLKITFGASASPAQRRVKGVSGLPVNGIEIPYGGEIRLRRVNNDEFEILSANCVVSAI